MIFTFLSCQRDLHVYALMCVWRASCLETFEREAHYKTRVWVSRLKKISKFISVNLRHGLHRSLTFYLFERGFHVLSSAFDFQHFDISHCLFEISNLLIFSLCSEVFFESLDQEESLWSYWQCWPQCPLQPTEDNPRIHWNERVAVSLFNQGHYLNFARAHLEGLSLLTDVYSGSRYSFS